MAELNQQENVVSLADESQKSLRSLLCDEERNFFIRNNGEKVKIEELEGQYVGLYFSAHWCPPCRAFTPILSEIYAKLLEKGDFEIVFISADVDEKSFEKYHRIMPWLALPFSDENTRQKLEQAFQVNSIPCLVVIDKEGKVVTTEGVKIIGDYGVEAYPFSAGRLDQLRAEEEALRAAQTVESLLVSGERDFVIAHGGRKIPVSELVGKTVALYFSAHWCPPCRSFTPKLIQVYTELKERGEVFEVVFISSDEHQDAFEDYYSSMPWLALPFGDKTKMDLTRHFRVEGIPTMIVLGPNGKTVTDDAISVVSIHGSKAYPFTDAQLIRLQKEIEDLAEKSPKEIQYSQHEHPLVLVQSDAFNCDGCDEEGSAWSYYCKECDYDIHLTCALKDQQGPEKL